MDNFIDKILPLIINGHYTEWFFNVVLANAFKFARNNIELLLLFAFYFQKLTKLTKTTWDDKVSNWLTKTLSKVKPTFNKGEKNEKKTNNRTINSSPYS